MFKRKDFKINNPVTRLKFLAEFIPLLFMLMSIFGIIVVSLN